VASGRETLSLEGADGALKTSGRCGCRENDATQPGVRTVVMRKRLTTRNTRQAVYNWLKRLQEKHL
jgi:hypothetical protein